MIETFTKSALVAALTVVLTAAVSFADLPQPGDLVFGLGNSVGADALEIVRGPATGTGAAVPDFWDEPRIGSVRFDNFNGISHNASGNLIGVDFGPFAGSGSIFSLSTTNDTVASGQLIGDTIGLGGSGLFSATRLASLSISPSNDKIAVMGYDAANVIVYDYTPGDTMGGGASLSGARETAPFLITSDSQGTAWLDTDTVMAFDSFGSLYTINANTMATNLETSISTPFVGSDNTALLYNPEISPMLFAAYSGFDGMASNSKLYVLDPASSFSLVNTVDLSTSGESIREMAFDADGNLYYSTFGSMIEVILGAAANPAAIADNSGLDWYDSPTFAAFSGIDIGMGDAPPTIDADFNDDTVIDGTDIDLLTMDIANGDNNVAMFDLDGSGAVTYDDVIQWLADAGAANLVSMNSYLVGDANLDGAVDGQDFVLWNDSKFTTTGKWTMGDFNASGPTDGQDFVLWNNNKFQTADVSAVPEPAAGMLSVLLGLAFVARRRA